MADARIHIVHVQSEGNNKVGLVFLKAVGKRSESNRLERKSNIYERSIINMFLLLLISILKSIQSPRISSKSYSKQRHNL